MFGKKRIAELEADLAATRARLSRVEREFEENESMLIAVDLIVENAKGTTVSAKRLREVLGHE